MTTDVLIPKQAVIELSCRLFSEGRTQAARAFEERTALIKEGEMVPFQPGLARKYGLIPAD